MMAEVTIYYVSGSSPKRNQASINTWYITAETANLFDFDYKFDRLSYPSDHWN